MTLDWLPGAERVVTGRGGGSYTGGPFRGVLHRTEGSSIEGAVSVYRRVDVAPHLTVDIARRRIVQHTPFTLAARALENKPGGVDTNRRSALQVEIVGFSAASGNDDEQDVRWFGREVIGPLSRAFGIQLTAPPFYGPDCGWTLATPSARQRFTGAAWNAFNGWCSHQHVPEQSHWDTGAFKIHTAFDAAQEDDDMTPEQDARLKRIEQQLLGLDPAKPGWPQLGGKTLVDAVADIRTSAADTLTQLGGPAFKGWAQLGGKTVVDALAAIRTKIGA